MDLGRPFGIASLACVGAFAPELARSGEIGIPCEAGSYSPNGFEPCSPCPAGTYQFFSGADSCIAVAPGTWAPQGAAAYQLCACADAPLCTVDHCNAATGECTTHDPAPGCEPYAVEAIGTVTSTSNGGVAEFALGAPFFASWIVDPAELDRNVGPTSGYYRYAIRDLRVRVGSGLDVIEATGDFEDVYFESTPPRDSDYLDLAASPDAPGFERSSLYLTLDEGDDPAITSDAMPPAFPSPASFASRTLDFGVGNDLAFSRAVSDDFVLVSPEPGAALTGLVAVAALLARSRSFARAR